MSIQKKLADAKLEGVMEERARILWLMEDERKALRKGLDKVVLVEAKRHVMQIKIQLAIAIYEQLNRRIISNDGPPEEEK